MCRIVSGRPFESDFYQQRRYRIIDSRASLALASTSLGPASLHEYFSYHSDMQGKSESPPRFEGTPHNGKLANSAILQQHTCIGRNQPHRSRFQRNLGARLGGFYRRHQQSRPHSTVARLPGVGIFSAHFRQPRRPYAVDCKGPWPCCSVC